MERRNRNVSPTPQALTPATGTPLATPDHTVSGHRDNADRALKDAVEKAMHDLQRNRRPLGRQQSGE